MGALAKRIYEGLEHCMPSQPENEALDCRGCPYPCTPEDGVQLPVKMIEDMRALAKEVMPRVLARGELESFDAPVFLEFDNGIGDWMLYMYSDNGGEIFTSRYGSCCASQDGYGVSWRCWTQIPDEEERKAAPWG